MRGRHSQTSRASVSLSGPAVTWRPPASLQTSHHVLELCLISQLTQISTYHSRISPNEEDLLESDQPLDNTEPQVGRDLQMIAEIALLIFSKINFQGKKKRCAKKIQKNSF